MNNIKYTLGLLILLFVTVISHAQETDFDKAFDAYAEGDFETAIQYYTQYIEDNNSINAYYNRGLAYNEIGMYDKAIEDYNFCLDKDSTDAEVYYSRGLSYYGMAEYDKAIKDNKKAIYYNEKYEDAYTNLGLCYEILGNDEMAIIQYSKALNLDRKSAPDYYNRALSYQNLGDFDNAKADYERAIEYAPYDADYRWGLANLYYESGEIERSIDEYDEAINVDDQIPSLYYNRGLCYYDLFNLESAMPDFKKADKLTEEGDIDAKWYLVLCAEELGDKETALKYYEEVEKMDAHYEFLSSLDKNELLVKDFFGDLFNFNKGNNNTFYITILVVLGVIALILFGKLFNRKEEEVKRRQ